MRSAEIPPYQEQATALVSQLRLDSTYLKNYLGVEFFLFLSQLRI